VRIIDIGLLVLLVIGGIAFGWFSPPEAASVGSVGALLLCARRKRLNWASLSKALNETLRTSGMVYIVVVGALIFSVFISLSGLAENVAQLLSITGDHRIISLLIITVVLLLLGSILDGLALMLLTTPIFLPIIQDMGMSPVWFGIFLVRAMEIGFIHPPIGMNLFIINNIAKDVSLSRIFKGVLPFLASDFVHLLMLILIPATVTWLPAALGQ
jgi:tripartite ATP-independent transporter DctM subunit